VRGAFLACALVASGAATAFGGVEVEVRDATTGAPLEAFVIAREQMSAPALGHGSTYWCNRAAATWASSGSAKLYLPGLGLGRLVASQQYVEALAYRPGYCAHTTVPKHQPRIELRKADADPEVRLLYLQRMAHALVCDRASWSPESAEVVARLVDQVLGEARALPRDSYERGLRRHLEDTFEHIRRLPTGEKAWAPPERKHDPISRSFVLAPSNAVVKWDGDKVPSVTYHREYPRATHSSGASRFPAADSFQAPDGPTVVHCRDGAACDLNERDSHGRTALFSATSQFREDLLNALLEAGADPTIPAQPSGLQPIDVVIRALIGSSDKGFREKAVRMLDRLAAHPGTTLTAKLHGDLAAEPTAWKLVQAGGLALLVERRDALLQLPQRPESKPGCAERFPPEHYGDPPVRLRY
jgi:hypothetical protein